MSEITKVKKPTVTLEQLAQQAPLPQWVREMSDHYRTTGTYRSQDLRKLLGDPNRRVEVGEKPSLSSFLQQ